MLFSQSLTTFTQTLGAAATTVMPTTTSVDCIEGEMIIEKPGIGTTLLLTTTSALLHPLAASADTIDPNYPTVQEVNQAELYLESLSDEELAKLCETADLLIEQANSKANVKVLKGDK